MDARQRLKEFRTHRDLPTIDHPRRRRTQSQKHSEIGLEQDIPAWFRFDKMRAKLSTNAIPSSCHKLYSFDLKGTSSSLP